MYHERPASYHDATVERSEEGLNFSAGRALSPPLVSCVPVLSARAASVGYAAICGVAIIQFNSIENGHLGHLNPVQAHNTHTHCRVAAQLGHQNVNSFSVNGFPRGFTLPPTHPHPVYMYTCYEKVEKVATPVYTSRR